VLSPTHMYRTIFLDIIRKNEANMPKGFIYGGHW